MRKRELDKFEGLLLEMRSDILREIKQDMKEGREGEAGEGRDTYDIASDDRDREINLLLGDRDRRKLQLVDEALQRIESRDYGKCEECEGDISPSRLKAMPFSELCVTCQDEYEQAQRTMHTDGGDTLSARVPPGESEPEIP